MKGGLFDSSPHLQKAYVCSLAGGFLTGANACACLWIDAHHPVLFVVAHLVAALWGGAYTYRQARVLFEANVPKAN